MYNEIGINSLSEWKNHLTRSKNAHYIAAQRYSKKAAILTFSSIIISAISTALAIGGFSNENAVNGILYCITALNAANIVVSGIEKQLNWNKLSVLYKNQYISYNKLILYIEKHLILQTVEMENVINNVIRSYQEIEEKEIILPENLSLIQKTDRENFINSALCYKKNCTENEHSAHLSLAV